MTKNELTFRKDKDWSLVDGEICLASQFVPLMGSAVSGETVTSPSTDTPYASIVIECKKVKGNITGFVTHKIDFINLWKAFKEKKIDTRKEEVLIYWTTKHYENGLFRFFSNVMLMLIGATPLPKMIVAVCPKGTFNSLEDYKLAKDREVMVNVYGLMPSAWWVPDAIK